MRKSITDFDSEALAFAHCKQNPGTWLEIPAGEFNVNGLLLPNFTTLVGGGVKSVLRGVLHMSNSQGGLLQLLSAESIVCSNTRGFRFSQLRLFGEIGIQMIDASYYNVLDQCRMDYCRIGIQTRGKANWNEVFGGRSNCSEAHIQMLDPCNCWRVHSAFEGTYKTKDGITTGTGTGVLELKGRDHTLDRCWFEVGADNRWSPATIILDETTKRCQIIGGNRGNGFSVIDRGIDNIY